MAKIEKIVITPSKLELEGLQVTVTVRAGDWWKSVSISPIDYNTFKNWHKTYAPKIVESVCKQIEYELKENRR